MSDRGYKHSTRPDYEEDDPPLSRIFVVCSKQLSTTELQEAFEKYGEIENLHMPRDRQTGESKGVAYIKYKKTSSAANAIKELNQHSISSVTKPIKVMLASKRTDNNNNIDEEKYKRLFIKVGKDENESDVKSHFSQFSSSQVFVHFLKNRDTNENKGVAFVKFPSFLDAAKGYEECHKKYKPMFATPRDDLKRQRNSYDSRVELFSGNHINPLPYRHEQHNDFLYRDDPIMPKLQRSQCFTKVTARISPPLPQRFIERLFNLISDVTDFKYNVDSYNGTANAVITYEDHKSASLAVAKLNNFELPSGEIVSVKPDNPISKAASELSTIVRNFKDAIDSGSADTDLIQLADAITKASSLIKVATTSRTDSQTDAPNCNIKLPPPQPTVDSNTAVAMRCFIICKPQAPPLSALRDVFCRFGDFINVNILKGKNYGYVKYASLEAGQEATRCIDGAIVCGMKVAVCEAEAKSDNTDRKRMKIDDNLYVKLE